MKKWIYDTKKEYRAAAHKEIGRKLMELQEDKRFIIEVKVLRTIHSIPQMQYFHVVCTIYATHTGHTMEEIKDEFKRARFFEMKIDKFGREFKRLKPTSGLDVAEYASLINNLLQWGLEEYPQVIIKKKEDLTYEKWIEYESLVDEEYENMMRG